MSIKFAPLTLGSLNAHVEPTAGSFIDPVWMPLSLVAGNQVTVDSDGLLVNIAPADFVSAESGNVLTVGADGGILFAGYVASDWVSDCADNQLSTKVCGGGVNGIYYNLADHVDTIGSFILSANGLLALNPALFGVSGDAGNSLTLGTDGLPFYVEPAPIGLSDCADNQLTLKTCDCDAPGFYYSLAEHVDLVYSFEMVNGLLTINTASINCLSADTANIIYNGLDNGVLLKMTDLVSGDTGNSIVIGSDGKLASFTEPSRLPLRFDIASSSDILTILPNDRSQAKITAVDSDQGIGPLVFTIRAAFDNSPAQVIPRDGTTLDISLLKDKAVIFEMSGAAAPAGTVLAMLTLEV